MEGGLGMPSAEIPQHLLRLNLLERMCSQEDGNGEFFKEIQLYFPSFESLYTDEEEAPDVLELNAEMRFAAYD